MYVIKFNNGLYWCAFNSASTQIRKAKIYTSLKMAQHTAEDCLLRKKDIRFLDVKPANNPTPRIESYTIVEVSLVEVGEVI